MQGGRLRALQKAAKKRADFEQSCVKEENVQGLLRNIGVVSVLDPQVGPLEDSKQGQYEF